MMVIRQMQTGELEWVNQQYQEIMFQLSGNDDFIAIAEISGVRAGVGRVVYLTAQQGELGGMYVVPEFRGHALASQIVRFLMAESGCTELFCIPFRHLLGFYQQFGFVEIDPAADESLVPEHISEKFAWCQSTYADPVALLHVSLS